MIALDTNVLVRFLVEDDPRQTRRARELIRKQTDSGEPLFVPDVVLVETVWVLARSYRFTRLEIAEVLNKLLASRQLRFGSADRIARALSSYQTGPGGFSDYVIREQAQEAGCKAVATFDRVLIKERGFQEL